MIYSSLLRIGVICLPGYAAAVDLTKTDNPIDGQYIVTTVAGAITGNDGDIGASSVEDSILNIITGGAPDGIGATSHGEVQRVYTSAMEGFTATLDDVGLQNVLNNPKVTGVEQDGYVHLDQTQVTWGIDRIDDENLPLDNNYKPTFGNAGQGVTAYIIDTGILASHNEFENRATQEFNSADDEDKDCNGHGTHVAGTVGSKNYGVANKVKLVGVKVLNCGGSGTWSGVIAGIDWVKANAKKPATANLSLGGGKSSSINIAIKNLHDSGVTTVVAAGNNNGDACDKSPASEPTAITVGSTTETDARSSFSNWGTCVDIFAPGSLITAPWIGSNTALKKISGTSMASPHVCGGAALYLGQYPGITPEEVLEKMLNDSIAGTISNVGTGSPNKFLHVGSSQSPTVSPAPTRVVTPAPTKPPTACPAGQTTVDNYGCLPSTKRDGVEKVYLYNKRTGPQYTHEAIAEKCGGHLASFTSQAESDSILTKSIRSTVWIGLQQKLPCNKEPLGCWYWTDGTPFKWLNWSNGEPNNAGGAENSAEVRHWDKKWNDNRATGYYGGIYILPKCFTAIEGCYLYKGGSKGCESRHSCRDGKTPLEIMLTAGDHGDENSVSMKVKSGNEWRKRKAIFQKGFENNKMTKITHCLRSDKCYKIAIKDKGGDGMSSGDGSYEIMVDGEIVKSSEFNNGSKETYEINC